MSSSSNNGLLTVLILVLVAGMSAMGYFLYEQNRQINRLMVELHETKTQRPLFSFGAQNTAPDQTKEQQEQTKASLEDAAKILGAKMQDYVDEQVVPSLKIATQQLTGQLKEIAEKTERLEDEQKKILLEKLEEMNRMLEKQPEDQSGSSPSLTSP